MNRVNTIIANYKFADEAQRLNLFLSHRDLRDAFMKIDMAQSFKARNKRSVRSDRRWFFRILQYCPGLFRL